MNVVNHSGFGSLSRSVTIETLGITFQPMDFMDIIDLVDSSGPDGLSMGRMPMVRCWKLLLLLAWLKRKKRALQGGEPFLYI